MSAVCQNPPYIPLIQKPSCCAVACLQMILYRRGFGLHDQEDLAIRFGIKVAKNNAAAFSSAMPIRNETNLDGGLPTVESEMQINNFLALTAPALHAKSYKSSAIPDLPLFISENLRKGNDLWVEYHAHEIHSGDELQGNYTHDGLIERLCMDDRTLTVIDSMPLHKQRNTMPVAMLERAISSQYGKETGFITISGPTIL